MSASGYCSCSCRDCFEIAIGDGKKPAYCHACETAGCPDYQGQAGMSQECQVENAYGDFEAEDPGPRDGVVETEENLS